MKDNKKVLVITYYWPPSGGSGVQRWLKFVKYLPSFGWTPYVFTPQNPSFAIKDLSLEKDVPDEAEVIRFPIWEPYGAFDKITSVFKGKKSEGPVDYVKTKDPSLFQKVSIWMRGNMIIPDPRVFWVKPSAKFLHDFLIDNKISIVITTGPPHSVHLIGYELKKKNRKLKWVADFRDPWSEWGLLDSLRVSTAVRNMHRRLEKRVLTNADVVTTITPFYVKHFERLSGREVQLFTNGFDEDDFAAVKPERTQKFIIRHVGIVNEKCDPRPLIEAMAAAMRTDREFAADVVLEFIGEVNSDFKSYVAGSEIGASVIFTGSVPHKDLLAMYGKSSLFVLVLHGYKDAEGYLPGKLFEYLATGLPVLAIGPEAGDAAAMLHSSGAGRMFSAEKQKEIESYLLSMYQEWKSGKPASREKNHAYSRRVITGALSQMLEKLS